MDLDAIQQIFFQECDEGLAGMEANFALLREGDRDPETINAVFRCVHSIKGGAGAFGHERLQAYTHEYETLLDLIRNGTLSLGPDLLDLTMRAFDVLADHVAVARDGGRLPDDAAMLARLTAAAKGDAPAPAPAPTAPAFDDGFDDLMAMLDDVAPAEPVVADWSLTCRPTPGAFDHGSEPLLLLRELALLGGTILSCDRSALPALAELDPATPYLGWQVALPGTLDEDDIRAVFDFVDACEVTLARADAVAAVAVAAADPDIDDLLAMLADPEPLPTPEPDIIVEAVAPPVVSDEPLAKAVATGGQTIRVDLDRLDRLVNLVGELVITQAMLAQRLTEHRLGDISELSDLEHLTRELQESTMAIRAQPMKTVFSRVPRIIRELEGETGKRVRLEVEGEMTEVDKTVVERIGEPLTHLIRNAVDHGLETPDVRTAAGKPAEGLVRLSAAHHSGRIVITVTDDGRGIDRRAVLAKAIERGIVLPDAALSDDEIDNLIFAPGFSTAAAVSNISGRGVGMDVVRRNIQALGGRIGIQSREGHGSSFSLSLPLTLAVLDGMIVTVGSQTFVIPLGAIVESLRPTEAMLNRFGPDAALLDVRGAYVPVLPVARHLDIGGAERDATQAVLIVVEGDQGQAALLVDSIQDQRQVVVKSLEANYRAIDGVSGATILGDGRVALILDVDALTAHSRAGIRAPLARAA
ncbi:chemotaxis protein CheA [Sphingomonas sp. Leaf407]|uniref:chemotaxis protein CheA n=1 Tax=unclassified Sphingomonas TaxID=196159 RepID=UPI0006F6ABE2|nr:MULTISPECIES: chemotaxis protein CheA [unclassified Sphingomonas]KQN37411.1 chemotaxis protein CheA [Sphingomonas sp. Leaf42]KQT27780.1 chemotaxis protein CheA [Sphingomonas sp. Leaf407]